MKKLSDGWFIIKIVVKGDTIIISNNDKTIFSANFSIAPYKQYYDFPLKQGEIGLRCYQGVEETTIRYFNIKEI